jgi:hypothetical protein
MSADLTVVVDASPSPEEVDETLFVVGGSWGGREKII